jgi:crotonobetainyl-CoA:carnitine CoA-transferase CaiB-like acyl-CoA transferase
MQEMRSHVLGGYKVLDFTQYVAGPTATRMMAEMGAEIIKIELAKGGDPTHALPQHKNGRSGYYVQQNVGKKSWCIDAKNPKGLAIIKEIIPKVDVLVENFAPGVIGRIGLPYETVRTLNPRIIMCSVSAFGQQGPLAKLPGYDYIAQAYAGVMELIGDPGECPYLLSAAVGDVGTGANAALAIVSALLHRERTGEGQYLDIALLDTYFYTHHSAVQMYSASDGKVQLTRSGRHLPYTTPATIYHGHDHYIVIIAGMDHHWRHLCDAMGRPELAADPRFRTNAERVKRRDALTAMVQDWLTSLPSDDAIIQKLMEFHVPAAPVLSIAEVMHHPHLRQRGTVKRVRDKLAGELELPGFPLRFSAFPDGLDLEAPTLGEHNDEILEQYLGYSPERIQQLRQEGIIFSELA